MNGIKAFVFIYLSFLWYIFMSGQSLFQQICESCFLKSIENKIQDFSLSLYVFFCFSNPSYIRDQIILKIKNYNVHQLKKGMTFPKVFFFFPITSFMVPLEDDTCKYLRPFFVFKWQKTATSYPSMLWRSVICLKKLHLIV